MRLFIDRPFKRLLLLLLKVLIGRKPIPPEQFKTQDCARILVIRQHDYMGDFLLSIPVLKALRMKYPCSHIGLVAREYFAKTVSHNKEFDELLVYRKKWGNGTFYRFLKQLRADWDLCVVLNTVSHSLTSDLLAWASGAKFILGPGDSVVGDGLPRQFLYDLRSPVVRGVRHETERNLDIVRYIGADTDDPTPHIHVSDLERDHARQTLDRLGRKKGARLIGMHLGAGKPGNRWPVDRFAELASRLHDDDKVQLVATFGLDEEGLGKRFLASAHVPCLWGGAPPVRELAALFAEYDAIVVNDTGMLHLAAAVGTPLVGIFGPTDPERFCPLGEHFLAVQASDRKVESVTVEMVLEAMRRLPPRRNTRTHP
jgi:ADP-heptose:LPS heptosyltransferase